MEKLMERVLYLLYFNKMWVTSTSWGKYVIRYIVK